MTQTIKYFSLALQTIAILQKQLISLLPKSSISNILDFKKTFDHHLNKINNIELQKSIQNDKISEHLLDLNDFLQKSIRIKKTSQSERYNYRSSLGTRQNDRMRLTGTFSKQKKQQKLSEIQQIIHSYKIVQSSPGPKTRMKWRTPMDQSQQFPLKEAQSQMVPNNIELLSLTIPEMQNRIKLLSVHRNRSPNSKRIFIQRQKQIYRTLETRNSAIRRYIPRLI